MKVHRLWIKEYRVLRDLTLEFSPGRETGRAEEAPQQPQHALDLLVGVNGTGKSTVLRALAEAIRRIQGDTSAAEFGFRITYERKPGPLCTVENVDEAGEPLVGKFRVREGPDGEFQLRDDVSEYAPPTRFVTYTTGRETAWADDPDTSTDDADSDVWGQATTGPFWLREQPGAPAASGRDSGTGKQLQIRSDDLPLVTLCGLLEDTHRRPSGGILAEALKDLGIRRISAFRLRFRLEPGAGTSRDRQEILALQPLASRSRVQGAFLSFVFDVRDRTKAEELLGELRSALSAESTLGLFEKLVGHSRSRNGYRPLLDRVDLILERTRPSGDEHAPDLHTYDWLSDGERTFLARMCMLSLFGAANTLILLDEPEVHFNDYWKRKLVQLLDRALQDHHSHAIITTHSSIVLTDVRIGQLIVLDRSENGYTSRALKPGIPTYAADPSDVLVQVFGAEQASGAKGVEEVRELLLDYEGIARSGLDTARQRQLRGRLEQLQKELGPGYWRFRVRDALREMPDAAHP